MARAKKTAMAEHSQETNKVEVCHICGGIGFSNAVLYCSECSETVVHQYCLGLDPKTIDDSYEWDCEYCSASKPSASTKSSGAFTQRSEGTCSEHSGSLKEVELEMTYDNFPYPKSCTRKGKRMKRKGAPFSLKLEAECKRIKRNRVEDHSLSDRDEMEMILFDDQPPPLCILLPPVKGQRSSIHAEIGSYGSQIAEWSLESASSWMDCPKEITRGIVLLVTPSGEIVIYTR